MDFELVTKIACRLQAISNFAYDIHYNARGKDFYENHLFAERIGDQYATASFKDEIFETVFLGRGQDVPSSKDIEEGVLVLTPAPSENEEQDYKILRGMISACLVDIESLEGLSLGEGDLFGRIASILQRHNGLLFARLSYSENEVVENSENEDEAWKYLINSKDDIEWITVRGTHIPLGKGESKSQAIKNFFKRQGKSGRKRYKSVKEVMETAKEQEKAITKDIKELTEKAGGKNVGIDFRLKSQDSALRKVKEVFEDLGEEVDESYGIDSMWDLVRYTAVFDKNELVEKGQNLIKSLKSKGYKIREIKNTWNNEKNPYKGINIKIVSPEGQKMELQIHTDKNVQVKEKMHKVYEKSRIEKSESKKEELRKQMEKIGEEYERPIGVENFEDKKKLGGKNKEYTQVMEKLGQYKGKEQGTYDFETGKPVSFKDGYSVTFHQNQPDEKGKYKSHFGRYTKEEYDEMTKNLADKYGGDVGIGVFGEEPEISFHVASFKDAYNLMKQYNQLSIWDWRKGREYKNKDYDKTLNPMKG